MVCSFEGAEKREGLNTKTQGQLHQFVFIHISLKSCLSSTKQESLLSQGQVQTHMFHSGIQCKALWAGASRQVSHDVVTGHCLPRPTFTTNKRKNIEIKVKYFIFEVFVFVEFHPE